MIIIVIHGKARIALNNNTKHLLAPFCRPEVDVIRRVHPTDHLLPTGTGARHVRYLRLSIDLGDVSWQHLAGYHGRCQHGRRV